SRSPDLPPSAPPSISLRRTERDDVRIKRGEMIMSRKIALITGASRGLGRSAALHLARKGVDIVITYRTQKDEADRAVREVEAAGGRAVALSLDTAKTAGFAGFAEE